MWFCNKKKKKHVVKYVTEQLSKRHIN